MNLIIFKCIDHTAKSFSANIKLRTEDVASVNISRFIFQLIDDKIDRSAIFT